MHHALYRSVTEMTDPGTLSEILGVPVSGVARIPLEAGFAHSGSGLEFLVTQGATGPGPRLVLKRIALEWDWLMRVTEDYQCRSTTVWVQGLLDRLPSQCMKPVLACCRDGMGWAILMRDYSDSLLVNRPFSKAVNNLLLETMATMHVSFLEDPVAGAAETGLCTLYHVYRMFAPGTARAEIAQGNDGEIPGRVLEGWDLARETMPRDVMEVIDALLLDPTPLCSALAQYPSTLVHGDFRHSNLGITPDSRVVLLDWQLAAWAPPGVELGRYLGANSPLLPDDKETCLNNYHARLADRLGTSRVGPLWWQPQLDLGLLGGFLQDGWAIVLKATRWHVGADARDHWKADLAWWTKQVRRGAVRLGF